MILQQVGTILASLLARLWPRISWLNLFCKWKDVKQLCDSSLIIGLIQTQQSKGQEATKQCASSWGGENIVSGYLWLPKQGPIDPCTGLIYWDGHYKG